MVVPGVKGDEGGDPVGCGHVDDVDHDHDHEMPSSPRSYKNLSPSWRMEMDDIAVMPGGSADPIHERDPELLDIVIREARDAGQSHSYRPCDSRTGGGGSLAGERDKRGVRE